MIGWREGHRALWWRSALLVIGITAVVGSVAIGLAIGFGKWSAATTTTAPRQRS
jgi:NADPH:quinone reductase-like Zn-dependent oxidoreductase